MKVKATQVGFFGGVRRRPGDEFEVPQGTKGSWFAEVPQKGASVEPAEKKVSAKAKPVALSQIGKEPAVGPLDNLV